jgi:predicted  nucleic acid-binding Zn-ribbon protein
MKTVDMDVYAKLKNELKDLHRENNELRERNAELERLLTELHGEYMLLRYQFKGLPSPNEFLKLRQEMQTLKKELRDRGWKDLM